MVLQRDRLHGDAARISGTGKYSDLTAKGEGYWVGAMRASDDHSIAFSVADLRELDDGVKRSIEKQADKVALYGDTFQGCPTSPKWTSSKNLTPKSMICFFGS